MCCPIEGTTMDLPNDFQITTKTKSKTKNQKPNPMFIRNHYGFTLKNPKATMTISKNTKTSKK